MSIPGIDAIWTSVRWPKWLSTKTPSTLDLSLSISSLRAESGGVHRYALALFVIIFQIVYRLSIKLPAIAIGKQSYSYKESWNDSAGEILQFVILGTIVAFLGKLVSNIEKAMALSLPQVESFLGHYALISVEPLVQLFFAGLLISMLTYTYAYFAEDREL